MKINDSYIKLSHVRFFSHHGVMPHEKITGNDFEIDLTVHFSAVTAMKSGDLDKTINYALIYEILKEEMATPTPLLEEVCYRILKNLNIRFPQITSAEITLTKLMPPIAGFQGAGISFTAEASF